MEKISSNLYLTVGRSLVKVPEEEIIKKNEGKTEGANSITLKDT